MLHVRATRRRCKEDLSCREILDYRDDKYLENAALENIPSRKDRTLFCHGPSCNDSCDVERIAAGSVNMTAH